MFLLDENSNFYGVQILSILTSPGVRFLQYSNFHVEHKWYYGGGVGGTHEWKVYVVDSGCF